jgi:esterase/lipase superfamily enzyme
MPTPNIYLEDGQYPESSVPHDFKSNTVNLLYVTDRAPETSDESGLIYGSGRTAKLDDRLVQIAPAELLKAWKILKAESVPNIYS